MQKNPLGLRAGAYTTAVVLPMLLGICDARGLSGIPAVFPEPRESEFRQTSFALDEAVPILLPKEASKGDSFLAQFLAADLSDQHGVAIKTYRVTALPRGGRFILMGSVENLLVKEYCSRRQIEVSAKNPGREGYVLHVDISAVVIAGSDDDGAFYGLQSLRQLIANQGNKLSIRGARIRDWPHKPFRGVKLYLPGREHIAFFKRFVREFMALYKFNRMIIEVNAAMRLDRHPELNAGWIEFGKDLIYTRRERSWGPRHEFQDSANADTADGGVLEKAEVAELVRYAHQHHIEVIPEIPSLTHSYYLLTRHRELAEIAEAEWPDTYCPSNPKTYDLLFDVLDEYIDVMKPRMVHVGHDEWRMPVGVCPLCKGKDQAELYAKDLNKIYSHLRQRNIQTAIWGDHLIERLRGKGVQKVANLQGASYEVPGGLSSQQVKQLIPKDILVFNWFWDDREKNQGEVNDASLQDWGFQQAYGNMTPDIQNYARRSSQRSVIGGAPSSWAATTELNFGKDLMYDFLGSASLLWSTHGLDQRSLSRIIQGLLPGIRRNLSTRPFPAADNPAAPVNLAPFVNVPAGNETPDFDWSGLRSGTVRSGSMTFDLVDPSLHGGKRAVSVATGDTQRISLPREVMGITIGEDVSSVVFLHASAQPAGNIPAHESTWNYADTADLLGWYEVLYEDGFVETIPIRYGVNILAWNWGKGFTPRDTAYEADLVDCGEQSGGGMSLFAFEWVNPRLGKAVKEVHLRGSTDFRAGDGRPISGNAILLAGISVTRRRIPPEAKEPRLGERPPKFQ